MPRFKTSALVGLFAAAFMHGAAAISIWDESADGDLSNDPGAPTVVAVDIGTNTVSGSSQFGDMDIFTITVPDSASFAQLLLTTFDSTDDLAFLAIEAGSVITDISSAASLLGWLHTSAAFLGTDILDDVANGAGAIGFTPPLGPGTYTLWVQQTGSELVGYAFDLILVPGVSEVPEPAVGMLFALGLGALAVARRRRL